MVSKVFATVKVVAALVFETSILAYFAIVVEPNLVPKSPFNSFLLLNVVEVAILSISSLNVLNSLEIDVLSLSVNTPVFCALITSSLILCRMSVVCCNAPSAV